jgi:hypothetical protein
MGTIAANVELLNGMTVEQLDELLTDTISLNLGTIFNNASILGISGLGILGITTGLIGNFLYSQYLTTQIKELSKMSNSNITEQKKASVIDEIKQKAIDTLYEFNISLRSLNDINGYINSNITTPQTIPSLITSNLYLNTGNITGINTINATTGIFGTFATTNNTNVGLPTKSAFGGIGDKIIINWNINNISIIYWNEYK